MGDRPEMEPKGRRVTTIVLSYNRPRMLREALDSIKGSDEIILLDDGSDFDVHEVASPFKDRFPRFEIRTQSKLTLEERLSTPRVGKAINQALRDAQGDAITYLCDDDLFHKDWIPSVRTHLLGNPAKPHVIYAQWNVFTDGEVPGDTPCKLDPFEMTTGNFAHLQTCPERCALWWGEETVACHDGFFIYYLQQYHPKCEVPKPPGVIAGWRRMHPFNMINFCWNQKYTYEARGVLKRGLLE